jgi:hypothetical protein
MASTMPEEVGAAARLVGRFHCAELRFFRREDDWLDASRAQNTEDFVSTLFREVVRKEAAIANDDAKCKLSCHEVPQGLEPRHFQFSCGTAEAVPFPITGSRMFARKKADGIRKPCYCQQAAPPDGRM